MSADDYRAQLIAVAADAVAARAAAMSLVDFPPLYDAEAIALAEAVIDALGIEQAFYLDGGPVLLRDRPVFTLGAVTDPSLTSET